MRLRRIGVGLAIFTATAMVLAACGTSQSASGGRHKVGVLFPGDAPYLAGYKKGIEDEAKAKNLDLVVVNAGWKADAQANQMNDLLAQKVDGIIVWAVDQKAIVPSLAIASGKSLPVIASNSEIDPSGVQYVRAYTGPNDTFEGTVAADLMNKALGGQGGVLVIEGRAGTAPQIRRLAGFQTKLAEIAPGIKILDAQPADWDKAKAISVTRDLLTKYGSQVKGIFGQDDTLAVGAAQAVKEAGLSDKIKVVGLGGSCDGFDAVKSGALYGTMIQSPVKDGSYAVDAIVNVLDNKFQSGQLFLPAPQVTKDTVAQFTCEW
jgi:ABC-type sugar transport system substrate-binding protein